MSEKSSSKNNAPYKRPNKSKKNESILGSGPDPSTKLPNVIKKLRKGDTPIVENMDTDEDYNNPQNDNLPNVTHETLNEEQPLITLSDDDTKLVNENTITSTPPAEGIEDSMHAPSNTDKGKAKETTPMDTEQNAEQPSTSQNQLQPTPSTETPFIKVPKATKFSATAPWTAVPGEKTWKKLDNVNHHFEKNPAYAGAKQYNLRKTKNVSFRSILHLKKACKMPSVNLLKHLTTLCSKLFTPRKENWKFNKNETKNHHAPSKFPISP